MVDVRFRAIFLILLQIAVNVQSQFVGDQCCPEDWDKEILPVFQTFKDNGNTSVEFLKEFVRWDDSMLQYFSNENPEGICRGLLTHKCNKDTKKCECSDILPFSDKTPASNKICGGKLGNFCFKTQTGLRAINCQAGFNCIQNPKHDNDRVGHCVIDPNAPSPTRSAGDGEDSGQTQLSSISWILIVGLAFNAAIGSNAFFLNSQ